GSVRANAREKLADPIGRDGSTEPSEQAGLDIEQPASVCNQQVMATVALEQMNGGRARGAGGHEEPCRGCWALVEGRASLAERVHVLGRRGGGNFRLGALSLPPICNCSSSQFA